MWSYFNLNVGGGFGGVEAFGGRRHLVVAYVMSRATFTPNKKLYRHPTSRITQGE